MNCAFCVSCPKTAALDAVHARHASGYLQPQCVAVARTPSSGGAGLNEELDQREVIADIWTAYQQGEVVTALVKASEVGDAITAMKWASKLAGLRHGTRIAGFDRPEVLVREPPYPADLAHFGADPAQRLLMFRPRPPVPGDSCR